MHKYVGYLAIIFLFSCDSIRERQKDRDLQTRVMHKINEQTPKFAKCAEQKKIYKTMDKTRIRMELMLSVNDQGKVQSMTTDDRQYPPEFLDCIYDIVEKIQFPKLGANEEIQLVQPLIFKE